MGKAREQEGWLLLQRQGQEPLEDTSHTAPSTLLGVTCLGSDATPEVGVERAGLEHRRHQGLVLCYQQLQGLWVGQ